MIIKVYNENHPYLLFIDLEFTNQELVQFAGILFKNIDQDTYQLVGSCNQYVTTQVCYPFVEYTSITNNFLAQNGLPLKDVIATIEEDFLADINTDELLLISHGLKNDRLVLNNAGLVLRRSNGQPVDGYCTFNNSCRILKRQNHLTLEDIANECGYYLSHAHNAFNDVWAEVAVFTYLKKKEYEEKCCL